MKQIKRSIWNMINSILLIVIAIIYMVNSSSKKIVYIDNVKLYNEFNMTKELGTIHEKKYQPFLSKFDSLVNTLKNVENKLNKQQKITKKEEEEYISLKRLVVSADAEVQELRSKVKMDINKMVWERLNAYVQEFGRNYNYDIILGAQGQGNIMYSKEKLDATQQFIDYANSKYEGN